MGVFITIRIGQWHDEDVEIVQNRSDFWIFSVFSYELKVTIAIKIILNDQR